MSINDNKGGKERATNGKIFDENIIIDTNNSILKHNILTTPIVAKASNVSVNNTEDYIVKNFLQAMNNNHKIEREEENNETEDINNINQESSSKSNNKKEKTGANTFHY